MSEFPFDFVDADVSQWPPGVWSVERSSFAWVDSRTKLQCAMIRHHLGHWCGYVAVPEGHPLHGKKYQEHIQLPMSYLNVAMQRTTSIDDVGVMNMFITAMSENPAVGEDGYIDLPLILPAHQGITYTEADEQGRWWFGFDCAHAGDFLPGVSKWLSSAITKDWVYRDQDYVQGIVTRLAWAIEEIRSVLAEDRDLDLASDDDPGSNSAQ